MTPEQAEKLKEQWNGEVIGKLLSKDMKHVITSIELAPNSDGILNLYVIGSDTNHAIPNIKKPLEDWLRDNNLL